MYFLKKNLFIATFNVVEYLWKKLVHVIIYVIKAMNGGFSSNPSLFPFLFWNEYSKTKKNAAQMQCKRTALPLIGITLCGKTSL